MTVTSRAGGYALRSSGGMESACGVYIVTVPDKLVQVEFEDTSCNGGQDGAAVVVSE